MTEALTTLKAKPVSERMDAHEKNIRAFLHGEARGIAQQYGYKFLAGCELLSAKQTVEHGNAVAAVASDEESESPGFLSWCKSKFKDVPYRTLARRMEFARDVLEKSKDLPLLRHKPLELSATTNLTPEEQDAIVKLVPEVMDGKGMVEFMQDMKLLKEPTFAGGLQATPDQLSKSRKPTAAEIAAAADEVTRERAGWILSYASDKQLRLAKTKSLQLMQKAQQQLGKQIEKILEQRKGATPVKVAKKKGTK